MSITINGSGTINGLTPGGLPNASVIGADLAPNTVTPDKLSQRMILYTKSASGTAVEFTPTDNTGITPWAKRVTLMFSGLSSTVTTNFLIQIGSTTFTTSGYSSVSSVSTGTNYVSSMQSTSGFGIYGTDAATAIHGTMTLNLVVSNIWMAGFSGNRVGWAIGGGGNVTLAGVADRIRIVPETASSFDAGTVAILIEG